MLRSVEETQYICERFQLLRGSVIDYAVGSMSTDDTWKGTRYNEGFSGVRLLVLGESTHGGGPITSRGLVNDYIAGRAKRWGNTYTRFLKILTQQTGPFGPEARHALWSRIAFFNYVFESNIPAALRRPFTSEWSAGAGAFEARFLAIDPAPQAVVVWGYSLWGKLIAEKIAQRAEGMEGTISLQNGSLIPTYCIEHPSRPIASTRIDEWGNLLTDFVRHVSQSAM